MIIVQVLQVFQQFSFSPPSFQWPVLRAALSDFKLYLAKVEDVVDEQFGINDVQNPETAQVEGTIMVSIRHIFLCLSNF
jgi:hypothetical protein